MQSLVCDNKNISPEYLTEIEERLKSGAGVVIENKDFEKLIKVYDRPNALFYCDPPYRTAQKYYDVPFSDSDHERLKNSLSNIKGRFILSYNDGIYTVNCKRTTILRLLKDRIIFLVTYKGTYHNKLLILY